MYIQRKKPKILIFESAVLYQRKTRIMSLYRAKYVHSTGCCRKNVLLSKSTASPRCALIMACMRSILYTRLRLAGLFPKTDAGQGIRKMLNFFLRKRHFFRNTLYLHVKTCKQIFEKGLLHESKVFGLDGHHQFCLQNLLAEKQTWTRSIS